MTVPRFDDRGADRKQPFEVRSTMPAGVMIGIVTVAFAVVLVSAAIAWDGAVPQWEADALRSVNGWPGWLEPPMWVVQQVGVLAGPVLGGLVIAWSARRWEYVIPFLLLMPLKLFVEKAVVKQLVERERPHVTVGPDVVVRGPAFEGLSFPSGHATTAFAFAILVYAFLPRGWRWIPLVWAVLVGVARLYFGEHNVLDVIAGAALGTIFATVLWYLVLNRFVEPGAAEGS